MLEAFAAIHRTPLRGFERNCGLTLASRTDGLGLDPLIVSSALWQAKRMRPFGLAVLATFRFVFKLLIVEEKLFPCCKNKICATVDALQNLVLELH